MDSSEAKTILGQQAGVLDKRISELLIEEKLHAGSIDAVLDEVMDSILDLTKGGKALRGSFVMTAAQLKGKEVDANTITLAALVEIIHLTLLVFDDVIDDGDTRRGIPTVHAIYREKPSTVSDKKLFGQGIAISIGLALEHFVFKKISELDVNDSIKIQLYAYFHRAIADTAYGELLDVYTAMYEHPTEDQVYTVLDYKTAKYTYEMPLHLGMLLHEGTDADFLAIKKYARSAGIAFQLIDDILGVFGTATTGKSIKSDIQEGKRTLLVVNALQSATPEQRDALAKHLGNKNLSDSDFKEVKRILTESGSLSYTREKATSLMKEAEQVLDTMNGVWNAESIDFLKALDTYVLTRDK